MSFPSFHRFVLRRPWLTKIMMPWANWYVNAAGYRQLGLLSDDLIPEENEVVQQALKRLSPQQSYDRVYRLRRAAQLSLQHKLLPKGQWTQPSQDVLYLEPLIDQIKAELAEKKQLDAMEVVKKH